MKVAFDHQIFSSQRYGGISRYHVELGKALNELGIDVTVFAPLHINEYLNNYPFLEKGKFLKRVPPKTNRLMKWYNNIISSTKINQWSPDIIHETYYSSRAISSSDIPTVVTVHDMIHERYPELFDDNGETTKNKLKTIKRAEHVICISENTKSDLLEIFDIPEHKVSVVYHGYNTIGNRQDYVDESNSNPFLLYVGSRNNYKNFKNVVKAFSISDLLKNNFNLIAFGGGEFTSFEKKLLDEYQVSKKSKQIGGGDEVLLYLYEQAEALIYPSLYEGFGMPVLEAMAHGCPVIASNKSSIPEVTGQAAELFDPLDLESMRGSIEKVLFSNDLQNKLILQGFEQVKKFSWKKCAKETVEVYNKIK